MVKSKSQLNPKGFTLVVDVASGGGSGEWFDSLDDLFISLKRQINEGDMNHLLQVQKITITPRRYKDRMK